MNDKAKRAPATFECKHCGYWCYEGSSLKNFQKLKDEFPSQPIKMEATKDDHISPIVRVEMGFEDWNTYIDRMYCEEGNWQKLCKTCDKVKQKEETEERKKWRRIRKEKAKCTKGS